MADIVERLRDGAWDLSPGPKLLREAADEVERLRAEKELLLSILRHIHNHGYVTSADYDMVKAAITAD